MLDVLAADLAGNNVFIVQDIISQMLRSGLFILTAKSAYISLVSHYDQLVGYY